MAIYKYQRVSTKNQSIGRQESQLDKLGISFDFSYTDKISGKTKDRPSLNQLLLDVVKDDIVYVESISRLGRNVDDLRSLCAYFNEKGVIVYFVKEGINTSGDGFKFILTVLGAVAEMEREQIVDRVRQGVQRCIETKETKTGNWFGRQNLTVEDLPRNFLKYYTQVIEGKLSKTEMAKLLQVSRPTLYRYFALFENGSSLSINYLVDLKTNNGIVKVNSLKKAELELLINEASKYSSIDEIILFGSSTNTECRKKSDLDLCFIINIDEDDFLLTDGNIMMQTLRNIGLESSCDILTSPSRTYLESLAKEDKYGIEAEMLKGVTIYRKV